MSARKLQVTAHGYRVLHARRGGGATPDSYRVFNDVGTFQAAEICEELAPAYNRAKVTLNLPALRIDAWQWKRQFGMDDRIAIVSAHAKPGDRHCPFAGFITDVEWGYGATDEEVTVTAVGNAFRLHRDAIVAGRYMADRWPIVRSYTGLPCEFNAGGLPNMSPLRDLPESDPRVDMARFTYDGDPAALDWTFPYAAEYLLYWHKPADDWLALPTITDYDGWPPLPPVGVEGMDLWSALARLADAAGVDICERTANDGKGMPASSLIYMPRGAGTRRSVTHQAVAPDGSFEKIDLAKTNLFSCRLAESNSSAVACPILAGGAEIVEITVALGKAWDPEKLTIPTGGILLPGGDAEASALYAARYCVSGDDFAAWRECGRLWDANTDGRYSGEPWNLSVPDVALLADMPTLTLPAMPLAAGGCLTQVAASGGSARGTVYVELSWDSGTTWRHFTGYAVQRGRLAVWLSADNLAGILRPGADPADAATENLFYWLVNSGSYVKFRITCSVALPMRVRALPPRRDTAGTAFDSRLLYDAGAFGQHRHRASSSRFYGGDLEADEADGGAALMAAAKKLQAIVEGGMVEGQLSIEWPDEPIGLTDRIDRIDGIGYELKLNAGLQSSLPRVVGKIMLLTHDTYSMAVRLETDRGAGTL